MCDKNPMIFLAFMKQSLKIFKIILRLRKRLRKIKKIRLIKAKKGKNQERNTFSIA